MVDDALSNVPARGAPADFDAIVLGAGVSGLVSASLLSQHGTSRVLVVDAYGRVGGNHINIDHGEYTFDVGSFVFQDDSPLLQHFPELLPHYEPIVPSWGKLNPQGRITRYPFSIRDDLFAAGLGGCLAMLLSAARARLGGSDEIRTAADFARYWLGAKFLHRSGLRSYMERFCGMPIENIDRRFAEKRMMWIAEHGRLGEQARRLLRSVKTPTAPQVSNQQLVRPRAGFTELYGPAVERLERAGVTFLLGADLKGLAKVQESFILDVGEQQISAPRVISTIPVDHALELCRLTSGPSLPTVTLISLFFSFSGARGFDHSIMYNFSHSGAWKRLTMHSDFYGEVADREYFAVEVIASRVGNSTELAESDFREHVAANGLFDGELVLEGAHTLAHAYPIYTEGSADRADVAITNLRDFGVESFGRQGGFQYQPTARVSTQEAEAALARR